MVKPTIYKPSIYKGAGVYNNGAGGGKLNPTMPSSSKGKDGEIYAYFADINHIDNGNIIPAQTDDSNTFGSSWSIYKVFDQVDNTTVSSNEGTVEFGYDFGEGNQKKINAVSVNPRGYSGYIPLSSYIVKGSNDRSKWDILACVVCEYGYTWYSTRFKNDNFYRYYSIVCNYGQQTQIEIKEIHMTDNAAEETPNTPQFFVKKFDLWQLAKFPSGFDCEPVLAVYRKNGYNVSLPTNIWGKTSSNIYAEAEFDIDEQIFNRNGAYTALIGWNNNWNAPLDVRIHDLLDSGTYYVEFCVNNTVNTSDYKRIKQTDFFARKTMRLIVDADKWKVYLDDELFINTTVGSYNYTASEYFATFRPLGGEYNNNRSHQLALKRYYMIDKDKNNLLFDLVAAKRKSDNTVGLFDRRTMRYYSFDPTYVGVVE